MPAGDQIDCYLSCNIRINKGELKKKKKKNISRNRCNSVMFVGAGYFPMAAVLEGSNSVPA